MQCKTSQVIVMKKATSFPVKRSEAVKCASFFLAILFCLAILTGNASAEEKKFQWSTRLTVSEQYDDNVDLTPDKERDDWITRIGPGVTLTILTEKTPIKLDYDFAYTYYAQDTSDDRVAHTLTLTGLEGLPISEHLTLDLSDQLYISDDPVEQDTEVTSVRRGRAKYYRNTATGSLDYIFGREDSLDVGFQHLLLINDDPTVQDGQRYTPSAGITYWFNIHNGINLDFSYSRGLFDETEGAISDDYRQYMGRATYTYRFSPRTQTTLFYNIDSFDYDEEVSTIQENYVVQSASLGVGHQFTEHTSALVSAGFWLRDLDAGDNDSGFLGTVNLTHALEKLTFNLDGSSGYDQQFLQAENLGFTRYYRASATLNYQPLEKLTAVLSGFYSRDEYRERVIEDRDDDTWGGTAGLSYLLLPWLSTSLTYDYRQRDSTVSSEDYTDNRVTFSLVAFYLSEAKSF